MENILGLQTLTLLSTEPVAGGCSSDSGTCSSSSSACTSVTSGSSLF